MRNSAKREMALVMLINRIQNPGDWKKFTEEAKEFVNMVYEKEPEEIKQIIKEGVLGMFRNHCPARCFGM